MGTRLQKPSEAGATRDYSKLCKRFSWISAACCRQILFVPLTHGTLPAPAHKRRQNKCDSCFRVRRTSTICAHLCGDDRFFRPFFLQSALDLSELLHDSGIASHLKHFTVQNRTDIGAANLHVYPLWDTQWKNVLILHSALDGVRVLALESLCVKYRRSNDSADAIGWNVFMRRRNKTKSRNWFSLRTRATP